MKFLCAVFVSILLVSELTIASAKSEPTFAWSTEQNSETRIAAGQFFASKDMPAEKTRVLYKVETRIDGDTVTERVKVVRFFSTTSEIEQDGNGVIYWDQEVQSIKIREAGVLSPDTRYQRFQKENYRVLDDDGYNTFTNNKRIILPFSGLQAGDVSVLEYESSYKLSQLESNWSHSYYPVTLEDTRRFELSIKSNSIELNSAIIGDRFFCETGTYFVQCSGQNLRAYQSDTGVIWRDIIDQIYVSDMAGWEEVIDHSLQAFNKAELSSGKIAPLFEKLVESATSIEDKIARIQEYVSRDIRYVSLSELGHRITPHTVASVDENKFGDCKDKTAMLVALLRKLGLDAQPYLIATERNDPARLIVPSTGYFDHMVACFKLNDRTLCIDGTDTNTNWQFLSSWIQGAVALPLVEGANPIRLYSKDPRWTLSIETKLSFDSNGKQHEDHVRKYMTSYSGDIRAVYRAQNDDEKKESAMKQYHQWVSDSVTPLFTFREKDSMSEFFSIESTAEYEPFLDIEKDLNYKERDHWLRYELLESRIKTQYYNTEFDGLSVVSVVNLDVSQLWKPTRLPANLDLKGRYGMMTRNSHHKGVGRVEVKTVLNLPRQSISKSEIKDFNEYLELLAEESMINLQGDLIVGDL